MSKICHSILLIYLLVCSLPTVMVSCSDKYENDLQLPFDKSKVYLMLSIDMPETDSRSGNPSWGDGGYIAYEKGNAVKIRSNHRQITRL